jgi:hypothetical protein
MPVSVWASGDKSSAIWLPVVEMPKSTEWFPMTIPIDTKRDANICSFSTSFMFNHLF